MKKIIPIGRVCAGLGVLLWLAVTGGAQQKSPGMAPASPAYDVSRENVLQGTVVAFTRMSTTPPLGAHVTVQTSSGIIDVHLGSSQLLEANHFSLTSGQSVKIVGESLPFGQGAQFFARVIESGSQSVALRSVRGFPLRPAGHVKTPKQGGAL